MKRTILWYATGVASASARVDFRRQERAGPGILRSRAEMEADTALPARNGIGQGLEDPAGFYRRLAQTTLFSGYSTIPTAPLRISSGMSSRTTSSAMMLSMENHFLPFRAGVS